MSLQKKRQTGQTMFDSSAGQQIKETTPSRISSEIFQFASALSSEAPRYIPVAHDQSGIFGFCSDGVAEKIKVDGGTVVFGWTIWEWPCVLLTGEFHAVWSDPDGNLIDITPKPQGERRILFVPDRTYSASFNFDDRPNNRRSSLYKEADRTKRASDSIEAMKPSQADYETRRANKKNMSLLDWVSSKLPEDPLMRLVDDFITTCNSLDRLTDILGAGKMEFHPTREYIELYNRKLSQIIEIEKNAATFDARGGLVFHSTDPKSPSSLFDCAKQFLAKAEVLFDHRHSPYEFSGVNFDIDGPHIRFAPFQAPQVYIELGPEAADNLCRALYQLAHEVIHLLAPMRPPPTIMLEEGIAVWFSIFVPKYPDPLYREKSIYYLQDTSSAKNYRDALDLYEEILKIDSDCIRKLRSREPVIHLWKPDFIRSVIPGVDAELAKRCCERRQMR